MMRTIAMLTMLATGVTALRAAEPIRCIEPSDKTGTSRAVVVGNVPLVFTSQVLPRDVASDPPKQSDQVLAALDERLRSANSSLQHCVKLNVYADSEAAVAAALASIRSKFTESQNPQAVKPAVSVVVTRLPQDGALVAIDAVAVAQAADTEEVTLRSRGARQRIAGSEHMAVLPAGRKIFVAGQAEKADDLMTATQRTMESLVQTLKFLGRTQGDIVQLKCFVKPVTADSARKVEAGLRAVLGNELLAPVVLVEWESSLPIEIELVAYGGPIEPASPAVEYLTPPGMTTPTIYSRVARTASQETIFTSGLFARRDGLAKDQTEDLFAQLGEILKAADSDFRHLAKATYYVADDDASTQLNALRPNYYDPQRPPAASKAMVRSVGISGRTITLDMIALPAR